MKKILINDLVQSIAKGAAIPENSAQTVLQSIVVSIDHAIAHQGMAAEAKVKTTGSFFLDNLPRESLVTMVMAGSGLTRVQAEQALQSVQDCLIQAIREDAKVEVENLGVFHVARDTGIFKMAPDTKVASDTPLIFEPFVSPPIPESVS